jgi:uncharacterized protein (TIGR03435 family)
MNDGQLLNQFAAHGSEDAFRTIVERHGGWVYHAALRQLGNPHMAQEATQAVFIALAQKAGKIPSNAVLSGWLFRATRFAVSNLMREEERRQRREHEAAMMESPLHLGATESVWAQISPHLNDALAGLPERDREAVLIRFFEDGTHKDVARALGVSEDAAKMRVSRALEKLRLFFAKQGFAMTSTALLAALAAHGAQAAPAGLSASVAASAAGNGTTAAASTFTLAKGILKLMAWTKAKVALAVGLGVLLAGRATGTLVFKKWETDQAYRDSWRAPGLDSSTVERALPQVRILPAKFAPPTHYLAQAVSGDRWGGLGVSAGEIVWAAYDWRPARIVFAEGPPAERYDFMANLPQGTAAVLRKELKKTLSLVARRESRVVDVLFLKVKTPDAPGLEPPNPGGGSDYDNPGRYYCDDRALSYPNSPHLGLTRFLEGIFAKPIIDQTGLTQHFRIDLKWSAQAPQQPEAIKQALLEQLGLELVPGRALVEMLVVEKAK